MTRHAIVVGFPYPSRYLADLMNQHAKNWRLKAYRNSRIGLMRALWALRSADALISFGGPGPNTALALAAHQRGVPLIVIWAGTDVLAAEGNPFELEVTKRDASADLAVAPWLASELRTLGVPATYQPIIAADTAPVIAPFPKRFTVLTYLPAPRRTFYGEDKVYAIARALKEARFLVVGGGGRNPSAPPNVEFLGWIGDTTRIIDASCVLLRLPDHDGQSMMVLEAMSRGRHVVWTHDIPGVSVAEGAAEALDVLSELDSRHLAGTLDFNTGGRDYVSKHCSRSDVAASFEACLDRATTRRNFRLYSQRKRVAISGYGLFCADVAKHIERLNPEWEAQILRPTSRLQVLTSLLNLARSDVWYSIGSPVGPRPMQYCAQLLKIPRVLHWVGSDIELARSDADVRRAVQRSKAHNLAEVEWTARELEEVGLQSDILPLPARHQGGGVMPLPERFTIMLYLPKVRPEFYGMHEYQRLLAELNRQDIRVYVVGGGSLSTPHSAEVINCGWRSDLSDIYQQSTLLIRYTPHDGLALMVLEALSFGRHAIWTRPFPFVNQVNAYDRLSMVVRGLLKKHQQGTLQAQYVAAEMVRERYSAERCVGDILSAFDLARKNGINAA